jgi:hypothetical protein
MSGVALEQRYRPEFDDPSARIRLHFRHGETTGQPRKNASLVWNERVEGRALRRCEGAGEGRVVGLSDGSTIVDNERDSSPCE